MFRYYFLVSTIGIGGDVVPHGVRVQPTLRLMRGKPCPGAGGLAGRGPRGGLVFVAPSDGEAFLLNGFSLNGRCGEHGASVSECGVRTTVRPAPSHRRRVAQEAERVVW